MEKESENAVAFLYTLAAKLTQRSAQTAKQGEHEAVSNTLFILAEVAGAAAETLELLRDNIHE